MNLLQTVYLAAEDRPGLAIGRKLISSSPPLTVDREQNCGGFGELKKRALNYQQMASFGYPVLLLADLDLAECPAALRLEWLGRRPHECFLFRVAVREIEAWLLADRNAIARFLRIRVAQVPDNPEQIQDPKRTLLTLARAAPRKIRDGLLPERGSSALVGPGYNDLLAEYVHNDWDIEAACYRATSLRRAMSSIRALAAKFS
jgi:hypothetical protein